MEKIDILVATYNGEKYVKEQLDSIINQTYKDINIIISDDGSKDSTLSILKEYQEKYPNITVYTHEKNLGYKKNFEFLLTKVESDYYMLSDQDDVWLEEKVEKCFNKLKQDNADLVYCDLLVVDDNLNLMKKSYWDVIGKRKKIKLNDIRTLYLDNCVTGCTILSKKSFIKDIVPIPQESVYMLHDYWIALIVALKGKITYLDEKCIKYRQHVNNQIGSSKKSLKMNNFKDVRDMFITIKKEHFQIYKSREELFDDKYKKLNDEALKYYDNITNKNIINFKGWGTFFKLYKYEKFGTFMIQFVVLNIPIIGKLIFFLIKLFKKRKEK